MAYTRAANHPKSPIPHFIEKAVGMRAFPTMFWKPYRFLFLSMGIVGYGVHAVQVASSHAPANWENPENPYRIAAQRNGKAVEH